jgi:signal transduction histidine kinase
VELLQSELQDRSTMLLSASPSALISALTAQLARERECLVAIEFAVRHQSVVTTGVLEAAKLDAGQLVLAKLPYNLHAKIRQLLATLKPQATVKGNSLSMRTLRRSQSPPFLPPIVPLTDAEGLRRASTQASMHWEEADLQTSVSDSNALANDLFIMGDEDRLSDILVNLIVNSLKFTSNGEIRVDIEPLYSEATSHSLPPLETPPLSSVAYVFTCTTPGEAWTSSRLQGCSGASHSSAAMCSIIMAAVGWDSSIANDS